jgi:hypothetical protein
VKNLCKEKFKAMGEEDLFPLCEHVKEIEHEYRECEQFLMTRLTKLS